MRPAFLRGLLIVFAAVAGGIFGAVIGLGPGPWLIQEACGYHLNPERRLVLGAAGLLVWTPLAAIAAAAIIDGGRPIRGTLAKTLAPFRVRSSADLPRARRWSRRLSLLMLALWFFAANVAIGSAYLEYDFGRQVSAHHASYEQPPYDDELVQHLAFYTAIRHHDRRQRWLLALGTAATIVAMLATIGWFTSRRHIRKQEARLGWQVSRTALETGGG